MQVSWKHILGNAIGALVSIPTFLWLVFSGSESSRMVLLITGFLAAVSALAAILLPSREKGWLGWVMQAVGSLLFAVLMLVVQPGSWLGMADLLGLNMFGLPMTSIALWVIGCFGVAWFLQEGIGLLLGIFHGKPGYRDLSSVVVFFALFVFFCVVFYSLRFLCPVYTHGWQLTADTKWLSEFGWPMIPGIVYQIAHIVAYILHSSDQTALGFTLGIQIFCYCTTAAFAGSRLYLISRKFWIAIVYALIMVLWYPCWNYLYALDGLIWTAIAVLLMAASLPVILQDEESPTSSWIALIFGAFLFSVQVSWGWMLFCAFGVLFVLFTVWKHWVSALGVLAVSVCLGLFFYFALPFLGAKADASALMNAPIQQIARVVSLDRALTSEETVMISALAPMNDIKETYHQNTIDPMRSLLNKNESLEIMMKDPLKYWQLYLKLSMSYPIDAILNFNSISGGLFDGSVPKVLQPAYDSELENPETPTYMEKNIVKILNLWMDLTNKFAPVLVSPGFQFWMLLLIWAWACGQKDHVAWSALLVMMFVIMMAFAISYFSKIDAALPLFLGMPVIWMWPACALESQRQSDHHHHYDDEFDDGSSMKKVSRKKAEELFDPSAFPD